jgi:hypothetical protein
MQGTTIRIGIHRTVTAAATLCVINLEFQKHSQLPRGALTPDNSSR